MVTSIEPIRYRAEARGHLRIAQTYLRAGGGEWATREAVDHVRKVLEYVLDQMDENHPESSTDIPAS